MPNPLVVNAAELLRRQGSDRHVDVDVSLVDLGIDVYEKRSGQISTIFGRLLPRGDAADTTAVYLISDRPFAAALR